MVLDLLLHTGKNLDIVTEAKAVESYKGIRDSYDRLMAGSVALELAAQVTRDGDDIPRLYALTRAYLDNVSVAPETVLTALLSAYLLKALAIVGYSPELDLCARYQALNNLFITTFATTVTGSAADMDALLPIVIRFAEKHLPMTLKTLNYYRIHF
jgi:DNA repair protein RecO